MVKKFGTQFKINKLQNLVLYKNRTSNTRVLTRTCSKSTDVLRIFLLVPFSHFAFTTMLSPGQKPVRSKSENRPNTYFQAENELTSSNLNIAQ